MYSLIIIDDEENVINTLENFINEYYKDIFEVQTFTNSKKALEYIKQNAADIVITDINMSNINGLELIREINESQISCLSIIISAYNRFDFMKQAIKYNVLDYIVKPIDFDELSECIDNAIAALNKKNDELENFNNEIFLLDLISGNINSAEMFRQRIKELNLDIAIADKKGELLHIYFPENHSTVYEQEVLPNIIGNIIISSLSGTAVHNLFNKNNHFYYIITYDSELDTLYLADNITTITQTKTEVHSMFRFESLYDFIYKQHILIDPILTAASRTTPSRELMQKAVDYINKNFDKDLTREDVAKKIYMSPAYFSKYFKEYTSLTFLDYLTRTRIKNAIELLKTNARISDIAKQVGYQNENRFFVNFKKITQYSPNQYKKILSDAATGSSQIK